MGVKYLSVCSGIEAATVAWHPLGWKPVAFSEVEPFPSAVLAHHYPETPNLGDMTTIEEQNLESVDLLVGGTPCQSFSVAGLRKGLDDPRGNLMLAFGALARRLGARWLVWENVPGVLSSNRGRDFGAFLGMLGELGYGFAYRVLDAQYFGVAQRRRRVFVVGHAGNWRRAAAVLFERDSLSGNPAPRRQARKVAPTIPSRSTGGGGLGTDFGCEGGLIQVPDTCGALTDGAHMGGGLTAKTRTQDGYLPCVANPLTARMHKGINTTLDEGQTPILTGGGFDAVGFNWQNAGGYGNANEGLGITMEGTGPLQRCQTPAVANALQVRRLTPRECERLQGFPDDYTAIPWRKQPVEQCPDGPRYKALGNSMAVPVMRWIGERIATVESVAS